MADPLRKPDALNWDPAAVELPEVPLLPPGQDAMSATIAGVLPTLAAPLSANVAALSAKETMFAGKLGVAQASYQNADDSGQQSIGQLTGMLGQVGQLGQSAAAPAQAVGGLGGQTGMFGSLMQQAMQAAQGGGTPGGTAAGGTPGGGTPGAAAAPGAPQAASGAAGPGATGATGAPQPLRDDQQVDHRERLTERPTEAAQDDRETAAAGPSVSDDRRPPAGPVPVTPPEPRQYGDGDLARRM